MLDSILITIVIKGGYLIMKKKKHMMHTFMIQMGLSLIKEINFLQHGNQDLNSTGKNIYQMILIDL